MGNINDCWPEIPRSSMVRVNLLKLGVMKHLSFPREASSPGKGGEVDRGRGVSHTVNIGPQGADCKQNRPTISRYISEILSQRGMGGTALARASEIGAKMGPSKKKQRKLILCHFLLRI
jgi:hypothetical protein